MSNEFLEKKKFTQTAVLFSMTGHIFIRGDASEEYYKNCVEEIREDAVYKYVMSSVPESIKLLLWQMTGTESKDVDPILQKYLYRTCPNLAMKLDDIATFSVRDKLRVLEKTCLTNEYIELSQISFLEVSSIAAEVKAEMAQNEKKINKT